MDKDQEKMVQLYLASLSKKERVAYHIAKTHLGSSFSIEKSIGFITFLENYCKTASIEETGTV